MVEDYEALYLLQNVLKSITVQIHNQKSETVYKLQWHFTGCKTTNP